VRACVRVCVCVRAFLSHSFIFCIVFGLSLFVFLSFFFWRLDYQNSSNYDGTVVVVIVW